MAEFALTDPMKNIYNSQNEGLVYQLQYFQFNLNHLLLWHKQGICKLDKENEYICIWFISTWIPVNFLFIFFFFFLFSSSKFLHYIGNGISCMHNTERYNSK